jgi:hypothetical protein
MRDDQRVRLAELSEKLADGVLEEADPALWPGAGQPLADMSKEDRGNRYWSKKNAAATFSLLERAIGLAEKIGGSQPDGDGDLDEQIQRAEKEAAKLLDKVTGAARKAAFDKRTHGKAAS